MIAFSQVNALFDYAATSAEEFSFSTGDVIAVTGTDVRPELYLHPLFVLTSTLCSPTAGGKATVLATAGRASSSRPSASPLVVVPMGSPLFTDGLPHAFAVTSTQLYRGEPDSPCFGILEDVSTDRRRRPKQLLP